MDRNMILTVYDGTGVFAYQLPSDLTEAQIRGQQEWQNEVLHLLHHGPAFNKQETWWKENRGQIVFRDGTVVLYEVQQVVPLPYEDQQCHPAGNV